MRERSRDFVPDAAFEPASRAGRYERLLWSLLPGWYEAAERYEPPRLMPDGNFWPARATRKPKTGSPILDGTPLRLSEVMGV